MTEPIYGEVASAGASRISATALADLLGYWSASGGALYQMLASRISRLADTAGLPPGIRLPPERELAAVLSVSRNTVATAYQILRDEGMAESRRGSGTRIAPHRITPAAVHRANGFFARVLQDAEVRINLTLAAVDCAPQVAAALDDPASVLDRAARREITSGTGYFPYGVPSLRTAIAAMLTTRHGLPARTPEVLITTGAQQALDLLIRREVMPGRPVIAEDPTFPGALDALHRSGARLVGVRPGDVERLERAIAAHRPGLVYLIPTYQNPVGSSLPLSAREQVVALAAANPDVVFIDDMTLADVTLSDSTPPPPLAALAPDLPNIVTIGSLSKTHWAGLRIGWIRAPEGILAGLAAAKSAADLGSSAYHQAIAAELVAGQYDQIVKWRTDWLRPRYAAIDGALRAHLPACTWTPPEGGLTIWARLPGDADSEPFTQAALRRGIAMVPGRLLSVADDATDATSYVRIAYTRPPDQLTAAIETLAGIL
ncbi:MAG TPA: PLP-dependent aminotransferase family protein [Trebonia sp.]|jgi:DNA-binding transcriptional MocR family regulator|nr:PLP-dependent aminotransferase family protein [Trebonia sp.]